MGFSIENGLLMSSAEADSVSMTISVSGSPIEKLASWTPLLFAASFAENRFNWKPLCSLKLMRRIWAFSESFCNVFSARVADRFLIFICEGLNFPGVCSSERTS